MANPNNAWRPEYSVGNLTLDHQHRELLDLCIESERLLEATPADRGELHRVLNELAAYAELHFTCEERLLREIAYPDLADQEREHEGYREAVARLLWQATLGDINAPALRSFLVSWWTCHIVGSDMKYKPFIAARSASRL